MRGHLRARSLHTEGDDKHVAGKTGVYLTCVCYVCQEANKEKLIGTTPCDEAVAGQ